LVCTGWLGGRAYGPTTAVSHFPGLKTLSFFLFSLLLLSAAAAAVASGPPCPIFD